MDPQIDTVQVCGNCRWWLPDSRRSFFGKCAWNDGIVPEWAINPMDGNGNSTTREFGKDCPTWTRK
jgi:hypothetical protein